MAEIATLARPYANAVFDIAKSEKNLTGWSRQLSFAAAAAVEPSVKDVIDAPSVTNEEKAKKLAQVCGEELSQLGRRFVQVLARNKRLQLLPEISAQFEMLRAQEEKLLDVEVISAYELSEQEHTRLTDVLRRRFEREIQLTSHVDTKLVGGVIIRAGDTVIDGSVKGKLEKLAESLQRT